MINNLPGILKMVNFLLALLSIGLGILFPFFKSAEALPFFETTLYSAFFISFGMAYILFGFACKRFIQRKDEKRKYFLIANLVLFLLWVFLSFHFMDNYQKHAQQAREAAMAKARIFKIDPEGYRKKRTLYYTFEYKGQRFTGKKVNPSDSLNIGDSVRITFSTVNPEKSYLISE